MLLIIYSFIYMALLISNNSTIPIGVNKKATFLLSNNIALTGFEITIDFVKLVIAS